MDCVSGYRPSLPYEKSEQVEYDKRLISAPKLYGLNNDIWLEGKHGNFFNIKKFDFGVLSGDFIDGDDDQHRKINNYSFFATTFANGKFDNFEFMNCDFRYANLTGAEFLRSHFHRDCNFYGTKIQGTKLNLTQKQLLTTDPFIEKNCYSESGKNKKRIHLEKVMLSIIVSYFEERSPDDVLLKDIDFNKFSNGNCTSLPCIIRECRFFGYKFINCSFVDGELEKTSFEPTAWDDGKVEHCDFSRAQLIDVNFGCVSLKGSKFDDAEIRGANFARFINFNNPKTHRNDGSQLSQPVSDSFLEFFLEKEKISVTLMKSRGLQKEQLQKTSSFKKKKLIGNKFCMDMNGLNLSGFNLTGSWFAGDLGNVNFTDAVITDCVFAYNTDLTADQIKSTWNYKTGNMTGIKLPEEIQKQLPAEIQKQLDAEKQTVKN
jgi:uncharacterized protein YjbI with pentapeptide repeats